MKKLICIAMLISFVQARSIAQIGRVGINTTVPAAMLHVKDSSVVFTGLDPLPVPPGQTPINGAGTRMMWFPDKAAWRVGRVDGPNWDRDSIGYYSIAFGRNTKASKIYSTALGYNTTASGTYSTAMGDNTWAFGTHSTTMGASNIAFGMYSTAIGTSTSALGSHSIAIGDNTIASGSYATSIGSYTDAYGDYSISLGYFTEAGGDYSTAMGRNTEASGVNSTSMGGYTTASGLYSATLGYVTEANGDFATAMGFYSKAEAHASLVLGKYNAITNMTSPTTWIATDPVFVVGNGISDLDRKNAFTILKNGKTGVNIINPSAMLHIVKTGPSAGPFNSDATIIVESDEHAYIQFSQSDNRQSGILSGNSDTDVRAGLFFNADSSVVFKAGGNNVKMKILNDGNIGVGTTTPSHQLELSLNDAAKPTSNAWTIASDARLKKDIRDYTDGLETVLAIHPVWFTYTGEGGMPVETGVGVLAQELQKTAPYMVGSWNHTDESNRTTPYLSVNNGAMTYMLINAVKEQQQEIESLKQELQLQAEVNQNSQNQMADMMQLLVMQQKQIDNLVRIQNDINNQEQPTIQEQQ